MKLSLSDLKPFGEDLILTRGISTQQTTKSILEKEVEKRKYGTKIVLSCKLLIV